MSFQLVFKERASIVCRWSAIITAIAAPISTALASISSGAMMIAWLASGEALRSLKVSAKQPAGKMLLIFMAWLFIGTLYAATPWADRLAILSSWKKLAFTFILFGLFYDPSWKRVFVKSYVLVMVIAALISLPFWLMNVSFGVKRPPGIFMSNYSAQSMAFVAATICCIFLCRKDLSATVKLLLGGSIALFTFNILFISIARSGYVAFFAAIPFAVCCLYRGKKLPYIVGLLIIGLGIVVLTSTTMQQRIELGVKELTNYRTDPEMTSIGLRVIFFQNTVELIKERPIFGYGTSSFKSTYSAYVASKYSGWRADPTPDPHNQYLYVWLENGLIGLLLFLAYIFVAVREGMRNPPYGAVAACFLIGICATSLFNSHFKTFEEGTLLAFFTGILLARYGSALPKEGGGQN